MFTGLLIESLVSTILIKSQSIPHTNTLTSRGIPPTNTRLGTGVPCLGTLCGFEQSLAVLVVVVALLSTWFTSSAVLLLSLPTVEDSEKLFAAEVTMVVTVVLLAPVVPTGEGCFEVLEGLNVSEDSNVFASELSVSDGLTSDGEVDEVPLPFTAEGFPGA